MEQSFVSNEPSWTEFEYIKLCPQSPEGYSANDQVQSHPRGRGRKGWPTTALAERLDANRKCSALLTVCASVLCAPL